MNVTLFTVPGVDWISPRECMKYAYDWCSSQVLSFQYNERYFIIVTLLVLIVRRLVSAVQYDDRLLVLGIPRMNERTVTIILNVCNDLIFWSVVLYLAFVSLALRGIL